MSKEIFIVEDDHACETVLRRVIHEIDPNSKITWVESAEQAILKLRQDALTGKQYDLMIVDIFLTGQHTGIELWQNCHEIFPEIPILITSGMPLDRFFETIGRNNIAPPFLPKPFFIGECRQIIEGLLTYR